MIKAIDSQQIIIQTEQVNRIQQTERRHPEMQQHFLEIQAREEKKILQKAVDRSEESDRVLIRDEEHKEKHHEQRGRQEGESESSDEYQEGEEPSEGGHINIRV